MRTAMITGLNSQDGSYLADYLLKLGYRVIGTVRSKNPRWPIGFSPSQENLEIFMLDLGYADAIDVIFKMVGMVHELYNFAAQSHVGNSFEFPEETYKVTGVGACLLMDKFFLNFPEGKFYQASSSEMFGNQNIPFDGYDELDTFSPVSPYGVAKVMAHYGSLRHRESGRFSCCGILFNHESPRRHESFVTQKICIAAVKARKYVLGLIPEKPLLRLGNIKARRDWGYAPEYVEIIYKLMQNSPAKDYVIGTGKTHSVEEFAQTAFEKLDLNWLDYVKQNVAGLKRPTDIDSLQANPATANNLLGRELTQMDKLIEIMLEHQMNLQGLLHG